MLEEVFGTPDTVFDTDQSAALLARSRAAWELGDWAALAGLASEPLETYRDRAKLALLAAVGLAQLGRISDAQSYARLAQGWGCPAMLMARLLIGGVLNSLGRVASLCDDHARARAFFQTSIGVASPRADSALIGQARGQLEQRRLGLVAGGPDLPMPSPATSVEAFGRAYQDSPHFSMPTLNRLQVQLDAAGKVPYLLETKSLPRVGLHFVQTTLELVLGADFSFCEWYQEPGCCKKMPCAMTPHLLADPDSRQGVLRMTKSHDFNMADPVYPLGPGLERLVLVRDPVFSLTSWWILAELQRHEKFLLTHDIPMPRINFRHEREVVRAAMDIMDTHYRDPDKAVLSDWLEDKMTYMIRFAKKWGAASAADQRTRLVGYDQIPAYLSDLVKRKVAGFPARQKRTYLSRLKQQLAGFRPRPSPFSSAPSKALGFIYHHQKAFLDAREHILAGDEYGVFKALS